MPIQTEMKGTNLSESVYSLASDQDVPVLY
jgi:hypothetical protein